MSLKKMHAGQIGIQSKCTKLNFKNAVCGAGPALSSFVGQCSHSLPGVVPVIPPYRPC